ncbi:hypothetical protein LK07_24425 [Streptomyces pluripotens]|uniref:Lipoprotein n=1 Tax=Streptomyces pluripotens TaxID=1355015 RepID=A0A221P389_9ACTN|nr:MULTISPECIES: hypothetical protein [Streptomyces]ARP72383.1 hypothetical protein LK06_023260 [Streptomyces pluripotens]ASN26632.1 hypothetical protein LK07_24425 [Streptomyces pluripotens]KIE27243.1 hypothetical protein LK08_10020 [Streptomyces sp. MUSC 125]MCH0560048.1 hypothetical protein [Streptomyces sp. MUM 16J]
MHALGRVSVLAAVLMAVTTGCGWHHDASSDATPGPASSSAAPSGTPSGYAQMEKKVDAAESAAAAADRDAAADDTDR